MYNLVAVIGGGRINERDMEMLKHLHNMPIPDHVMFLECDVIVPPLEPFIPIAELILEDALQDDNYYCVPDPIKKTIHPIYKSNIRENTKSLQRFKRIRRRNN